MSDAYAKSGVDVEAGEHAVALMKASVEATFRPETVGDFGGFAGLFDVSALKAYRRPLLATGTDGVGTKVAIAQQLDIHDTVGIDLVAMIADDIVCVGAEPLFLTDYIATGKVVPQVIADVVRGVAEGCRQAGMTLIGGETAEHPGLMKPGEYDLAGAGVGVVEAEDQLGAHRVREGDVVLSLASSGLHSNGYSLARHVLLGEAGVKAGLSLEKEVAELGRTLGEELLTPTRIYTRDILSIARSLNDRLHAVSHITGGGIASNIARVVPETMTVEIERGSWQVLPIFNLLEEVGNLSRADLEQTFNLGLGMVVIVDAGSKEFARELLVSRGIDCQVVGQVRKRNPEDISDAPAKGGKGGAVILR